MIKYILISIILIGIGVIILYLNIILKSKPKTYTAIFPGPDTMYYYTHKDGTKTWFNDFDEFYEYLKRKRKND